jgi:hypothetical protein
MNKRSQSATEDRMIENIIENFDFVRCQHAMRLLNWEWFGRGIPTIPMLKQASVERLKSAMKGVKEKENRLSENESYFSSSGGLKGTAWKNRYGHVAGIKLEFILTDWDADGDY